MFNVSLNWVIYLCYDCGKVLKTLLLEKLEMVIRFGRSRKIRKAYYKHFC